MTNKELQDKIEALSDEFQSTFTLVDDGSLMNCAFEEEIPRVEALIRKHLECIHVETFPGQRLAEGYRLYRFKPIYSGAV